MRTPKEIFLKVFDYIESLDAFYPTEEFLAVVDKLEVSEWSGVEWIGRFFCMDNDVGEHWFDNWDLREKLDQVDAAALGYDTSLLLIIDPWRMQDGRDGPCHTDDERKQFWHDVLLSLHLSLQTIFNEAQKRLAEEDIESTLQKQTGQFQEILARYNIP